MTHPALIDVKQMSVEQLHGLLDGIRSRRMRLRTVYEDVQDKKRKARIENVTAQIEKKLNAFAKKLDTLDKTILKLEEALPGIQALTLEMEDLLDYASNHGPAASEGHSRAVEGEGGPSSSTDTGDAS